MSMTRSHNDERFEISEVSRRGAHRPRSNPLLGLLPLAALGVLVVGVMALAYLLFGRGGSAETAADGPVAAASVAPTPSVATSPGQTGTQTPEETSPSAATPSAETSPTPSVQATVDTSTVLNFYNGSSPNVPGLSRTAAGALKAKGWTIGDILTWNGAAVTRTTVYYGEPAQLATARAVIKELGVGVAKVNTRYAPTGLTVVISNDYAR
jgi:hypothetical protein